LTACNNVILVDLWWNPALEEQAFDRAHRYGQTRDVNIFKLKIDDTVEDRILEVIAGRARKIYLAHKKTTATGAQTRACTGCPQWRQSEEHDAYGY
jgi:hypothetical protein